MVGRAAGLTVMVRDTEANGLLHPSVAIQVSVTVPPHAPGVALNVDKLDVPLIRHPSFNPLVNVIVLGAGICPQATVMLPGAVIVGNAAGLTVMVRETEASGLLQLSVAVQVSVTVPPQAPGVALNVDKLDVPLIRHPSFNPLVKVIVLGAGICPQATVMFPGAVIVGNIAG